MLTKSSSKADNAIFNLGIISLLTFAFVEVLGRPQLVYCLFFRDRKTTQEQSAMLGKNLNFKFQPTRHFKREWISNLPSYFVIVQDTVNHFGEPK